MNARTRWADERLDDLKQSVDDGFREVKGSIDRVDGRVDALHRTMVVGFISLATTMLAGFGAIITLIATHY